MRAADQHTNARIDQFKDETRIALRSCLSQSQLERRLEDCVNLMQQSRYARQTLGRVVLGQLKAATAFVANPPLQLHPLGSGSLAIGHRLKHKQMQLLPLLGVSHVLTLLSASEGARAIRTLLEDTGITWLWLPLESGDPPPTERSSEIRALLRQVEVALDSGGAIYVHCAAGLHRTGMITHAYLRHAGYSRASAEAELRNLRNVTAASVGRHRLDWGEQFAH